MRYIETKTYISEDGQEHRVFYIDVGHFPPEKAEVFFEKIKAQFKAKKEANKITVED